MLWSARVALFPIALLFHRSPRWFRRFAGAVLGIIWWDILRIRRGVVFGNLSIAFPELATSEVKRLARRTIYHMGYNLIEYSDMPFFRKGNIDSFEFIGREHLDQALAQNKGVCLLTLHMGNGDLGMAGLACAGYPINSISKLFKVRWLNQLWFGLREKVGVRFIEPRNSSYQVLKGLKRKEVVIFVMDQFTGPPIGCRVRFFGRETGAAMGLGVLAIRSGAPVVPAYDLRMADGRHRIVIGPPIPTEGDAESLTQTYTDWIEQQVRAYPEQWMWVHRRWKTFRN